MNPFSGPLDGRNFMADLPFIVLGWPTASAVTTFECKAGVWNYMEAASRRDAKALFARAYEFTGSGWQRIPLFPTYQTKRENRPATSLGRRVKQPIRTFAYATIGCPAGR